MSLKKQFNHLFKNSVRNSEQSKNNPNQILDRIPEMNDPRSTSYLQENVKSKQTKTHFLESDTPHFSQFKQSQANQIQRRFRVNKSKSLPIISQNSRISIIDNFKKHLSQKLILKRVTQTSIFGKKLIKKGEYVFHSFYSASANDEEIIETNGINFEKEKIKIEENEESFKVKASELKLQQQRETQPSNYLNFELDKFNNEFNFQVDFEKKMPEEANPTEYAEVGNAEKRKSSNIEDFVNDFKKLLMMEKLKARNLSENKQFVSGRNGMESGQLGRMKNGGENRKSSNSKDQEEQMIVVKKENLLNNRETSKSPITQDYRQSHKSPVMLTQRQSSKSPIKLAQKYSSNSKHPLNIQKSKDKINAIPSSKSKNRNENPNSNLIKASTKTNRFTKSHNRVDNDFYINFAHLTHQPSILKTYRKQLYKNNETAQISPIMKKTVAFVTENFNKNLSVQRNRACRESNMETSLLKSKDPKMIKNVSKSISPLHGKKRNRFLVLKIEKTEKIFEEN